ncbi:hypothetical protein V8C86DRAFT_2906782 [Haematococcus lacustris]
MLVWLRSCSQQRLRYSSAYCKWPSPLYCCSTPSKVSRASSSGGALAGMVSCQIISSRRSATWLRWWEASGRAVSLVASLRMSSSRRRLSAREQPWDSTSNLTNSCSSNVASRLAASCSIMAYTLAFTTSNVPSASLTAHSMSRCSVQISPNRVSTCRMLSTSSAYWRWCRLARSIFLMMSCSSSHSPLACREAPWSVASSSTERSSMRQHSRAALSSLLKLDEVSMADTNARCTALTSASAVIRAALVCRPTARHAPCSPSRYLDSWWKVRSFSVSRSGECCTHASSQSLSATRLDSTAWRLQQLRGAGDAPGSAAATSASAPLSSLATSTRHASRHGLKSAGLART